LAYYLGVADLAVREMDGDDAERLHHMLDEVRVRLRTVHAELLVKEEEPHISAKLIAGAAERVRGLSSELGYLAAVVEDEKECRAAIVHLPKIAKGLEPDIMEASR